MKRYLIKLKPLNPFFFGNEWGFGYIPGKNDNYIVRSNLLPQQTSILGMLRKEVLVQKKLLKEDWNYTETKKQEMEKFIGARSFNIKQVEAQDFGVINKISPLFITDDNNYYIPIPFDHKKKENGAETEYTPFEMSDRKINTCMGELQLPKDYNAKQGLSYDWIEIGSEKKLKIIKRDYIFCQDQRIGIKKSKEGKTEQEAYFKITYNRLNKDFQFAFFVDMDNETVLQDNVIYLGGERSVFAMTVIPTNKKFSDIIKLETGKNRIILFSDIWLGEETYQYINFAISNSIDFRNIHVVECGKKENDINQRLGKTDYKYRLLQRGSVLYTDEPEKLLKKINSFKNMVKIGYNITNKLYSGGGDIE